MTRQFEVELEAPRRKLFDYLADPRNRTAWQSSLRRVWMLSEGAPHVGMRWREQAAGFGTFDMCMSEYEPHRVWAEQGESPKGKMTLRLVFDDTTDPRRTRLNLRLTLDLTGALALAQGPAALLLQPLMTADLRRAARLALQ